MTRPPFLPGDPSPQKALHAMLRVDHAGEYGAVRIYAGQKEALDPEHHPLIETMAQQEVQHLAAFEELMVRYGVRPTVFMPLWQCLGYALGWTSGAFGRTTAMACTVAVEEVIDRHYQKQEEVMPEDLRALIHHFRCQEQEHRDMGYEHGAEEAPFLWRQLIKQFTKTAILLSTRW